MAWNLYFWLYHCMSNVYITYRFICTQIRSFWALTSVLISRFRVIFWFDSVCIQVASWVKFRQQYFPQNLQFSEYNVWDGYKNPFTSYFKEGVKELVSASFMKKERSKNGLYYFYTRYDYVLAIIHSYIVVG